jgi:fibronectin type 3 domain-containing protein
MNYLKNLSITVSSFPLLLSYLFCLSFLTACNSGSSSDTLTLAPKSAGSATLSWSGPTLNNDGSELTDLAGYKIYYGETATQLDMTISVSKPELTSYEITNLASDINYFFYISAINNAGYESQKSDTVELIL